MKEIITDKTRKKRSEKDKSGRRERIVDTQLPAHMYYTHTTNAFNLVHME